MSEEISREEIAALLARGSEETTREESKVKTFDILRFIADNAGLSIYEAIEKAYNIGLSEQEPVLDKIRAEIKEEYRDESEHPYGQGLRRALQILDKYKAESEK